MAANDEGKILTEIKAMLGLQPDYSPFDVELLIHINSVLSVLAQLGIGPKEGFVANADTAWKELLLDSKTEDVKSYVFLRVKMLFDSNTMPAAVLAAHDRTITELEFRITVAADPMVPQEVPELDEDELPLVLDAGEI